MLDEVANAERRPIIQLSEAQVHFALTDDGQLVLEEFGGQTGQEIFEFCYPLLNEAVAAGEDVGTAVQIERDRERDARTEPELPAPAPGRRTNSDEADQSDGVHGGQAATPLVQAAREAELKGRWTTATCPASLPFGFGWSAADICCFFAFQRITKY